MFKAVRATRARRLFAERAPHRQQRSPNSRHSPHARLPHAQGYAHGRDDALASLDEEIRRQAGRAYASLALEDETARAAALDAALQRLEATGPRCVPPTLPAGGWHSPPPLPRALMRLTPSAAPTLAPPPSRKASARAASECKAEEAAFLACTPSAAEDCAAPVRAYVRCADDVLFRMMNPGGKAAAPAAAPAAAAMK